MRATDFEWADREYTNDIFRENIETLQKFNEKILVLNLNDKLYNVDIKSVDDEKFILEIQDEYSK